MTSFTEIGRCRICGNTDLLNVLSLGVQALTGVFPRRPDDPVTAGPLDLVRCNPGTGSCGLVQLAQTYRKDELYGMGYGYRSGLNPSMVRHLQSKVRAIEELVPLAEGDLVLDIGANDGTLLSSYAPGPDRVGIDPIGEKFRIHYPEQVDLVPSFFSAQAVRARLGDRKAKVITSIAMFYDLDDPIRFVEEVASCLDDDGIWVLEQSYLPSMVQANAYDTICHEHLEYYGLAQIQWITSRLGLRIVDVELNDVNGGSFSVTVAKQGARVPGNEAAVASLLAAEAPYAKQSVYDDFREAVLKQRRHLRAFFEERRATGESVYGLGASTKGNVILQFCGITADDVPAIGEVNEDKFGCVTPGTHIPIVPEEEVRSRRPDFLLVLPWHFEQFFLRKEEEFREAGGKLCFPLPTLHCH